LTSRADGNYKGAIVSAYIAEDGFDAGEFVLKLDVNLEDGGAVTCRQALKDSEAEKRDKVLKALGLPWPFKFPMLKAIAGNVIGVNLKTSAKGNQNAYVATARDERVLTEDEVNAIFERGGLPF